MAMVVRSSRNCSDQKVTSSSLRSRNGVVARPFLLKDFLMDEMSSCSSNGFKSYPRRQCCATVRFLIDVDLTKGRDRRPKMIVGSEPVVSARLDRSRSRAATSALQRASVAVLNAVKLIPFPSVKSNGLLSRKLLKRSFWRRRSNNGSEEANRRCRLFGELLVEKDEPLDRDQSNTITDDTTAIATCSNSFDVVDLNSTTQDDAVLAVTEATSSTSSVQNAEVWQNHEEKEQFSPVSVLDCPFKDEEEEESGSKFQLSLARVEEGRSNKQKTRRFECGMARELEPLNLENRIYLSEHRTSISTNVKAHETEQDLEALLSQLKSATCHTSNGHDNLLLDFFRDSLVDSDVSSSLSEPEALTVARDWVNGTLTLVLGWEVREGRDRYVKDMDKERGWRGTASFEDVGVELECEVWSCLVNELVLDLL